MNEAMARDGERIDAALAQLSGEYRTAPATRNMLMVIAGFVVPLLVLIVVRLASGILPSLASLAIGGLLGLALFGLLVDMIVGALRVDAGCIERRSPWFWWNWRIARDEIAAVGVDRNGKGRYLVIETATGLRRRLPFRPGFERVLGVIA